ncbi:MAG: hypothetical protein WDM96_10750 [Lacunisphaera sp.]
MPLRIENDVTLLSTPARFTAQFNKNEAAVDSELSLLALGDYDITGLVNNPLYGLTGPLTLDAAQVVKVSRLDGPSWASARQLVDAALEGERLGPIGRYYVDLKGPHPDGDEMAAGDAGATGRAGFRRRRRVHAGDVRGRRARGRGGVLFRLVCRSARRSVRRARLFLSGGRDRPAHPQFLGANAAFRRDRMVRSACFARGHGDGGQCFRALPATDPPARFAAARARRGPEFWRRGVLCLARTELAGRGDRRSAFTGRFA